MKMYVRSKKLKPLKLSKLQYDPNSQDVSLLPGMKVISKVNCKSMDITNNDMFKIKKITSSSIVPEDEEDQERKVEVQIEQFQKLFYIAFCIT